MSYYRERETISPINKVKPLLIHAPKHRESRNLSPTLSDTLAEGTKIRNISTSSRKSRNVSTMLTTNINDDTLSSAQLDYYAISSDPLPYRSRYGLRYPVPGIQPSQYFEMRGADIEKFIAGRCSTELLATFESILQDHTLHAKLLRAEDELAQRSIDILQMLLDTLGLNYELRVAFLKTLLRLSKRTKLYPTTLVLKGVEREEEAVTPGHYGEIYKGKFGSQIVCLKIMKVYTTSQIDRIEQAFRKEALIWAHLAHSNVLPFYGIYRLNDSRGRLCLVSPWMDNGNIAEYLNAHPSTYRFLLIDDIVNGILYLHENNIIHGDLKSANIMISPAGRACLADFGLSTVLDFDIVKWTSSQSTAQAGGTTRWQAPELFGMGEQEVRVTKGSDMYALACMCYEIVTDKKPFHNVPHDVTVMFKVINGERPSQPAKPYPHIQLHDQWDVIWELMRACWNAVPSERLQAKDVAERLSSCNIPDLRLEDDWESVSAIRFRHSQRINFVR